MTLDEKMLIAQDFIGQGYPVYRVLKISSIASSTYYHIPKDTPKRKGIKKSTHTKMINGHFVGNSQIVQEIESLLGEEFVDYGYRKVTHWLRQNKKYIINEKKVYRLMRENSLLNKKVKHIKTPRLWVSKLVPEPTQSLEYFEFDIKYIYIAGQQRNALVLTVIDVESRWVLGQFIDWKINKNDVQYLFDKIFSFYDLPKVVYVRNDNGSQFVASEVRNYFKDKDVVQEFTKPSTPEQNAHIESYHSIMESVICQKYQFENLEEAQLTFNRWIKFYNFERIHSGIQYLSSVDYLNTKGITMEWNEELEYTLNSLPDILLT
jgi:transposase InsO family protein